MNTLTKVVSTLYHLKQTILNITWMRIFCLTWKHKHKIKGGGKSYLVYETSFYSVWEGIGQKHIYLLQSMLFSKLSITTSKKHGWDTDLSKLIYIQNTDCLDSPSKQLTKFINTMNMKSKSSHSLRVEQRWMQVTD